MMRWRSPLVLAIALVTLNGAAQAASWRSYFNDRFRVTADVPADWTMGPEPGNDDGRRFTSPDGRAEIAVYGNFADIATQDELAAALEPSEGERITYKKREVHWVVASGTKGDRIFYRKTLLSCGDTVANHVSIEYPAADKAKYDPLVAHLAASLKPGKGAYVEKCK
jgi:hypothetical protein